MTFLKFIVSAISTLLLFDLISFVVGFVAYNLGARKFGHFMIGHVGSSFGLTQHWLYDNCPYGTGHKCDLWTCKGYGKNASCPCKCQLTDVQ